MVGSDKKLLPLMRRVILSGRSRMCCLARQYSVSWSLLRWCQVRMLMYYWLFRQYYSLECRRSSFSFDRSSLRLGHRVDDVNRPQYWQGLCHMVHPRCVGSHICSSRTSALQTYHHIMLIVFSRCSSLKVVQRLRNPNLFSLINSVYCCWSSRQFLFLKRTHE